MALQTHVYLCPVGSAGDVYPYLGLGQELRRRGHAVTVMTSGYFADTVQKLGFEFVDTLSREAFLQLASHPQLWHPLHGARTIFRSMSWDVLWQAYRSLEQRVEPVGSVIVSSVLGLAARTARDRLRVPLVTIDLQPSVLWSDFDTPRLPGLWQGPWVPRWLPRWQFNCGVRYFINPLIVPQINRLRQYVGLPGIDDITRYWHSPDCILGMFPDWFAAPQPDWPSQLHLTGFPIWTESSDQPLSEALQEFLAEGDPPLVFTPGTAHRFAGHFFRAAIEACSRLQRRGLLLTRFPEQLPERLPPGIAHFSYAPFESLLPRVAAISHHGGIGTCATSMAAGIPQLVMPLSHDQPDNAQRLKKLGVGDYLPPRQYRGPRVADRLGFLLQDPAISRQCGSIVRRFTGARPFARASDIIESLLGS